MGDGPFFWGGLLSGDWDGGGDGGVWHSIFIYILALFVQWKFDFLRKGMFIGFG